jgi:hypothetical protein
MSEPMGGAAAKPDNKSALWALILGILGLIGCCPAAPFAWYMGGKEVKAIDAGLSAKENRGMAFAGKILGIIGTILWVVGVLIWFFLFGMAMISGMSQAGMS